MSSHSSSPPQTPRSKIRYAVQQVRKATAALQDLSELEVEELELKEEATDLGKCMTGLRRGLKDAQKNVDALKGSKRSTGAKGGAKPKRMKIEPTEETLAAMGEPNFLETVLEMYQRSKLPVEEWFNYALDKTRATASEDASLGFYAVARGIEPMEPAELASSEAIRTIISLDLEEQLLNSLDCTPIANFGYEQLWGIYSTYDPKNVRNKNHRSHLLQHIIQCVENIRFATGWIGLTNGGDKTAKATTIKAVYAIDCAKKMIEVDHKSQDFKTFCGKFKNYRTGARHVYDAYEEFRSAVLICPLLRISGFHESRVGAAMNNVVHALRAVETLSKVDFEAREICNNQVLKAVVEAFEGLVGAEDLSKMLTDMESKYYGSD